MVKLKYTMPGHSDKQIIGIIKTCQALLHLITLFFYFLYTLQYSLKSFLSFIYCMSSILKETPLSLRASSNFLGQSLGDTLDINKTS